MFINIINNVEVRVIRYCRQTGRSVLNELVNSVALGAVSVANGWRLIACKLASYYSAACNAQSSPFHPGSAQVFLNLIQL